MKSRALVRPRRARRPRTVHGSHAAPVVAVQGRPDPEEQGREGAPPSRPPPPLQPRPGLLPSGTTVCRLRLASMNHGDTGGCFRVRRLEAMIQDVKSLENYVER